eukprot:m.87455 g.87455  ORF g.87455 m.87455 type:complete len:322 (-) comp13107_c0_seq8:385-1350(-)
MSKRSICVQCKRPSSVCLCSALPPHLLCHDGIVLCLQHPFEKKRSLATMPLVQLVLAHTCVVSGRRFRLYPKRGSQQKLNTCCRPLQEALLFAEGLLSFSEEDGGSSPAERHPISCPLLLLYPEKEKSVELSNLEEMRRIWKERLRNRENGQIDEARESLRALYESYQKQNDNEKTMEDKTEFQQTLWAPERCLSSHRPAYILLVIDGTWTQAAEMYKALPKEIVESCIHVCLSGEGKEKNDANLSANAEESSTIKGAQLPLFHEPICHGTTTLEAIARALGTLENNAELETKVLAPLHKMVDIQSRHDPALRQRLGLAPT